WFVEDGLEVVVEPEPQVEAQVQVKEQQVREEGGKKRKGDVVVVEPPPRMVKRVKSDTSECGEASASSGGAGEKFAAMGDLFVHSE
ncbi:hypothetical protein HK104_007862, partial [Borealophlyctis nickersoniae]